jgi:hypothetical protein
MSLPRLLAIPVFAAIAAAVAAGCGGPQQVTAAELVQKGDAICRDLQATFSKIQSVPPANASIAADQTKELADAADSVDSKLHDMEPPEPLRDRYSAYLDARGRATDEISKGHDAADDQDAAAYGAAQRAVADTAPQRRRLARALGFKVCSSSPGAP